MKMQGPGSENTKNFKTVTAECESEHRALPSTEPCGTDLTDHGLCQAFTSSTLSPTSGLPSLKTERILFDSFNYFSIFPSFSILFSIFYPSHPLSLIGMHPVPVVLLKIFSYQISRFLVTVLHLILITRTSWNYVVKKPGHILLFKK